MPKIPPFRIPNLILKQFSSEYVNQINQWCLDLEIESWENEIYLVMLDKERELVRLPEEIYVLEKALALKIEPKIKKKLPHELVSYQKGRSAFQAVQSLSEFAKETKMPLYVLRRDIASYTDSIPLHDGSRLWSLLQEAELDEAEIHLLKKLLRAKTKWRGTEASFSRYLGVSTGSALTPLIANLYLTDLDRELLNVSGCFYRRYGDDIVFAHTDLDSAITARAILTQVLSELSLSEKAEKSKDILWNAKGGNSIVSGFSEKAFVDLLGLRITRSGIRLTSEKMKLLLKRFRFRIKITLEANPLFSDDDRAKLAVSVVHALFSRDAIAQDPLFRMMCYAVNEIGQWRELDHEVVSVVAALSAKEPLPYAFRRYSKKRLMNEFGMRTPGHLRQIYVP